RSRTSRSLSRAAAARPAPGAARSTAARRRRVSFSLAARLGGAVEASFSLAARLGGAVEAAFQVIAPIVAGKPAAIGAARTVLLLLALGSRLHRGLPFLALGHEG